MDEYKDLIVYHDEDDKKINISVKILDIDNAFVKFKTKSGNIISIPSHRILKIKQMEETK